ncbi:MAG: Hsp20/alpha crystallin family protein [Epsilonproteobacteria bacterium]|nr:Hsp20/alpha crystallin family protein [Campylobacterota bacterium]
MNLVRGYNPFAELEEIREQFNRLLNNVGSNVNENVMKDIDFVPAVNTREADDAYYIEVDLPGVKKEDITIDINENTLTIKGERKIKEEYKDANFYKVESVYGKFERSFALPEDADIDNIEAKFENGVLIIKIPKVTKVEKAPKKIEIK